MWRDDPPAKAANLISIYVLRLRRLHGDADSGLLVTRAPGYQLRVAAADTDALLFEAMVRDGRRAFAAGDPERAASQLTEALGLWYGRPLADVPPTPLVEAEAERLGRASARRHRAADHGRDRLRRARPGRRRDPQARWPTIRCGRACGCC